MDKFIKQMLGFIIIIILLCASGCSMQGSDHIPKVENGVLDLSTWNSKENETFRLDGNWDFYWNRLLTYDDIQLDWPDLYAYVPNTWDQYQLDGINLSGVGYATYRLHVVAEPAQETILGIRLNTFSSAYKLFIDDKEISSVGTIATKAEDEIGDYKPQVIFFAVPSQEFDIIIQVSNYEYASGGFWYSAYMGSQEGILNKQDIMIGKELVFIGVLLITSMSYLVIYFLKKELKFILYFSGLCFFMALVLDTIGQYLLFRIIEKISFHSQVFIWFTSINGVLFFLILLVHSFYKSKTSKIIFIIYSVVLFLDQVVIIFTKPLLFTQFAHFSNLIAVVGTLCTLIIVIVGIKDGHKEGWLHLICLIVVFITYTHDALYLMNSISSGFGEILYYGLFLSIFLQIILLIKKIKQFYYQLASAEMLFLQAQIKPHFLYNSLNTIISVSYYDVNRARELLGNFADYLRRSFDFKNYDQYAPLKNEIELAKAYTEIEKGRFEERLEVNFDVQVDTEVKVPMLILQPVIENAIIHGVLPKPEGGRVDVSIKQEGKHLIFKVADNGIGMKTEKFDQLSKRKPESGIGLTNITNRLEKLYGSKLKMEDNPTGGTIVTWKIPMNRKENFE